MNKMITFTKQWAEDNGAKINYVRGKSDVIVFNETSRQEKDQGNTIWAAQVRYPNRHIKIVQDVNFFSLSRIHIIHK